MKIMIIVNWYPPDRRVPARRWGNIVKYLHKMGAECTVISAGEGKDGEYTGENGERVIRVPISNRDVAKKANGQRKSAIRRVKQALYFYLVPAIFADLKFIQWKKLLRSHKEIMAIARQCDVIVSSYGPTGPFLLGLIVAAKTNKPWIADIRDSFDARDGQCFFLSRAISRYVEGRLLRRAKHRITIGVILANYLSELYTLDFSAVYNGWVDTDVISETKRNPSKPPYLYYAGSIYDHQIPALSALFQAISSIPRLKFKIRLLNDHSKGAFDELLAKMNSADQIEILPPVDQAIVDAELAKAVCAVVVEDISCHDAMRNGTVTGKLMALLASGIPGIAVSSKSGEIRHLVSKVPNWYGVDSVEQCVNALKQLICEDTSNVLYRNALQNYHMDNQVKVLYALIQSAQE